MVTIGQRVRHEATDSSIAFLEYKGTSLSSCKSLRPLSLQIRHHVRPMEATEFGEVPIRRAERNGCARQLSFAVIQRHRARHQTTGGVMPPDVIGAPGPGSR